MRQNSQSESIMTTRRLDRIFARIAAAAAATGLAAATLAFVVLSLLLPVVLYPWNEALIPVFLALILFGSLQGAFLHRRLKEPIRVTRQAETYFNWTAARNRSGLLFAAVLLAAGILLTLYVAFFMEHGRGTTLSALCFALTLTGSYCLASRPVRRVLYRRVKLCVADAEDPVRFDRAAERKRTVIKWSVYWAAIGGLYLAASLVFRNFYMYAPIPLLAAVNFLLRLAVNNPFRTYSGVRARRIGVRLLNFGSLCVTVLLCFAIIAEGCNANNAYIASLDYGVFSHHSSFTYDHGTGVYTLRSENEEFRILQLTDIHICGSLSTVMTDRASFDACYDLIRQTQPDLIIVTGDISYTIPIQTFSRDNLLPMYQFCTFMNRIGIPWAMVYGNHDTETTGCTAQELSDLYRDYFQSKPGCPMLYADVQPKIYGRYNQYLRIENPDGSLNRIIYLIDSNDYVQGLNVKKYDSVHDDQIQWYSDTVDRISAQEGRRVPSFVFMHIPFHAFADAQEALKTGEATYLFGKNEEGVSCPEQDTGFFDRIVEKGSTDAVFVGHDHLNSLGVHYRGVDLVYSKSIDYIAYPGISKQNDQRGGTLIVLSPDGDYRITQLSYRGR